MDSIEIKYQSIGVVHSPYKNLKQIPKSYKESGNIIAQIEIDEKYLESMADIKVGEEYMVLFHFHKSVGYEQRVHIRGDGPLTGLFSTHAPRRPNPIGVSNIRIKNVENNIIKFTGVDMLDGTPILDLKKIFD